MSAHVVVFITAGSVEEGQNIARTLVEERVAACVNIVSPIESVYRWQGKVQDDREVWWKKGRPIQSGRRSRKNMG